MTCSDLSRLIEQTTDRKLLRLLNRAWWREFFRERDFNISTIYEQPSTSRNQEMDRSAVHV